MAWFESGGGRKPENFTFQVSATFNEANLAGGTISSGENGSYGMVVTLPSAMLESFVKAGYKTVQIGTNNYSLQTGMDDIVFTKTYGWVRGNKNLTQTVSVTVTT